MHKVDCVVLSNPWAGVTLILKSVKWNLKYYKNSANTSPPNPNPHPHINKCFLTFLAHPAAVLTWICPQPTLERTRVLLNITGKKQQSAQKDVGLNHSLRQPLANADSTSQKCIAESGELALWGEQGTVPLEKMDINIMSNLDMCHWQLQG